MSDIEITQVDERDSHWEEDRPRFRVYLHGSEATSTRGWTDTYDVTGADVLQVIDWAQRQAGGVLTYAVALVVDDDEEERRNPGYGRGLVWLVGTDGNANWDRDELPRAAQDRMVARRRQPVVVPKSSGMPGDVPQPYREGAPTG